ncbi:uncharacterized protein DUF3396 [Agrobacterium vitis]|nr:uncharacterized protein DUF3396 [Agrobacterium vitis]
MTDIDCNNIFLESKAVSDLSKLTVADKEGNPALKFGFLLKLYFSRAYDTEVRERMIQLIEDYGAIFSNKITHYMPYDSPRLRPTKDFDYIGYFTDRMKSIPPEERSEGFDAEIYGFPDAVDKDEPTPYHIGVVTRPILAEKRLGNKTNALGRLEAYFPADWPHGDYTKLTEVLRRWAEIGQPIHGTFGFGLIMQEGCGRGPFADLVFPFLKRFPGFDYPDLSLWRVRSEPATTPVIRSINWLSLIDDDRLQLIGGIEKMRASLDVSCSIYTYSGGVIIQAGDEPKIGDVNRGEIPETYRSVAQLLKPLRFEDFGRRGIFEGLHSPLDEREETLAWLRRFDD